MNYYIITKKQLNKIIKLENNLFKKSDAKNFYIANTLIDEILINNDKIKKVFKKDWSIKINLFFYVLFLVFRF